jgi:gp16 family phage-associated protein
MDAPYPLPKHKPYTAAQVRAYFVASGETISSWAEANGYSRQQVYYVLGGQLKARRGTAHEIALKLGLKLSVEQLAAA